MAQHAHGGPPSRYKVQHHRLRHALLWKVKVKVQWCPRFLGRRRRPGHGPFRPSITTPSPSAHILIPVSSCSAYHLYIFLPYKACLQTPHSGSPHCMSSCSAVATLLTPPKSFPDLCTSLTLVNVPPPTEYVAPPFFHHPRVDRSHRLKDVFETYGEMLNMWCYPTDIEEFEHACLMLLEFALGEDVTPDIQDEVRASYSLLLVRE